VDLGVCPIQIGLDLIGTKVKDE